MKQYVIYMASHPSLGSYIGVTSMTLIKRREAHLDHALNGSNMLFHQTLADSSPHEWTWTIMKELECDFKTALQEENDFIRAHNPSLNILLADGKAKEGYVRGGAGVPRPPVTEEVREWFSDFHANRPRKRNYCRKTMIELHKKGLSVTNIAKQIGCDRALVHRVVTGEYKY